MVDFGCVGDGSKTDALSVFFGSQKSMILFVDDPVKIVGGSNIKILFV